MRHCVQRVKLTVRGRFVCVTCADDGWLEISPSDLDAMMRRAAGYLPSEAGEGDGEKDEERERSVKDMVHGVKAFVSTVSSHEGAEFPW